LKRIIPPARNIDRGGYLGMSDTQVLLYPPGSTEAVSARMVDMSLVEISNGAIAPSSGVGLFAGTPGGLAAVPLSRVIQAADQWTLVRGSSTPVKLVLRNILDFHILGVTGLRLGFRFATSPELDQDKQRIRRRLPRLRIKKAVLTMSKSRTGSPASDSMPLVDISPRGVGVKFPTAPGRLLSDLSLEGFFRQRWWAAPGIVPGVFELKVGAVSLSSRQARVFLRSPRLGGAFMKHFKSHESDLDLEEEIIHQATGLGRVLDVLFGKK
jgi:hypothetical protein